MEQLYYGKVNISIFYSPKIFSFAAEVSLSEMNSIHLLLPNSVHHKSVQTDVLVGTELQQIMLSDKLIEI